MGFESFLRCQDLFAHSSIMRTSNDEKFGTVAGGTVSIFIILVFSSLFVGLTVTTIQRNRMNYNSIELKGNISD